MDTDSKQLIGILGALVFLAFLGAKSCDYDRHTSDVRAAVQVECLKGGKTALECKELR